MKTVLCNGVFDLLHVAHVRHLRESAMMGKLVVGVTMDEFVHKPGRPIIPARERLEMVRALGCVERAELCRDSLDALQLFNPQIFVKGNDYVTKGLLPSEIEYCKENGIEIRHTRGNPQTTTAIIERICKCAF